MDGQQGTGGIEIRSARWEASIRPDAGGAVASLRLDGRDVLRPTAPGASDPFDFASFPLVPYANRIAYGRLATDGAVHHIPPNHAGQVHPLHGVGWLRGWTVERAEADAVELSHDHAADEAWPFAYAAHQAITVDDEGIGFTLALTNRSASAMPCSLGFHPYFAGGAGTSLSFRAGAVWLADEQFLPTRAAAADHFGDFARGQPVRRATLVDNSFAGWSGDAIVTGTAGRILVSAEGASVLHVYMPPDADFFCAEPATALPDGVNRAPDRIGPGEQMRITMRIAALD